MNNLSKEDFISQLREFYYNNAADFISDFTDLFVNVTNGEKQILYPKQVMFMNYLKPTDRLVVILKPRQCGISTAIVGKVLHQAYFGKVPEIGVISATKQQAVKILRRIKSSIENMREFMRPKLKIDNAQHLQLENGVNIYSLSSNPRNARGWSGDFFADEFAIHSESESEKIYEAIYPSITAASNARIVMVSTPLGKKGMFYKLATQSLAEIAGKPDLVTKLNKRVLKINWYDVPHIIKAKENGLFDGMPKEMLNQEYLLQFVDDEGVSYFGYDFLSENFFSKDDDDLDETYNSANQDFSIVHSYDDLDLPEYYLDDLDMPLLDQHKKMIRERFSDYYKIEAGWDIADTGDDSIIVINGEHKQSGETHILGEFLLNKKKDANQPINGMFDNTDDQLKYALRLFDGFGVESIIVDANGLGKPIFHRLENIYSETNVSIQHFGYSKNKEKLAEALVELKRMMIKGKLKRKYVGDMYCREFTRQMGNMNIIQTVNGGVSLVKPTTNMKRVKYRDDYLYALLFSCINKISDKYFVNNNIEIVPLSYDLDTVDFDLEDLEYGLIEADEININNWGKFVELSKRLEDIQENAEKNA